MMGVESGKYTAQELLSGTTAEKYLHQAIPFETSIEGKGAVMWKIKLVQK
jgi:hypothetical protein